MNEDIYKEVIENRVRFKNLYCIVIPDKNAATEINDQLLAYSDANRHMRNYLIGYYNLPALLWKGNYVSTHNTENIAYSRKMFKSYDIWEANKGYKLNKDFTINKQKG